MASRILIVDDEEALLRAAKRLFSPPHRVVTADRPSRALEAMRQERFDVVVSDYRMSEMNGVEFLERVRQLAPQAVRLLVTGAHDFETVVSAVNRGSIFRVLAKPFEIQELQDAINAALDLAGVREERDRFATELVTRNDALQAANTRLEERVRDHTREVLNVMVDALDIRGGEASAHSRRVAAYARLVAERMGTSGEALRAIELGALLHDVGTIGVREVVLHKNGPLTLEDWTEMRRHPLLGWELLQRISFLGESSFVCLEHHERWDGKGYPRGIGGEAIHLGARVFSVVDAYDAITSDRPYRKAQTPDAARAEITRCSGKQFDPRIVEVFLAIPEKELEEIRRGVLSGLRESWARIG
jgi:response regulator RpfG family c-di-GMP phosphodiesterase